MALKQQQDLLARLYTDPGLRSRFVAFPSSLGGELGLRPEEAEGLARVARDEIRRFGNSLLRKRLREVSKLLPRTRQAMGAAFEKMFLNFAESFRPTTVKQHLEDALAFCDSLQTSSAGPVAGVAKFECARLRHNVFGRRFSMCFLRHDPRRMASDESACVRVIGVWIAVGGWSRAFVWRFES